MADEKYCCDTDDAQWLWLNVNATKIYSMDLVTLRSTACNGKARKMRKSKHGETTKLNGVGKQRTKVQKVKRE